MLNNHEEIKEELFIIRESLDETKDKLDDMEEVNEETNKTLNLVAKKLDIAVIDRSIKPRLRSKVEQFVLMFIDDNKYYVIRGQKSYSDSVKSRKEKDGYRHILTITCTPNARYLLQSVVDGNTIERSLNTLIINNITEDDLINKINKIYEERKNITL
jgi:hypothetical protein